MNMNTWVQTLDKAVCISHSANTLGIGMDPTLLLFVCHALLDISLFYYLIASTLEKPKIFTQNISYLYTNKIL